MSSGPRPSLGEEKISLSPSLSLSQHYWAEITQHFFLPKIQTHSSEPLSHQDCLQRNPQSHSRQAVTAAAERRERDRPWRSEPMHPQDFTTKEGEN